MGKFIALKNFYFGDGVVRAGEIIESNDACSIGSLLATGKVEPADPATERRIGRAQAWKVLQTTSVSSRSIMTR